MYLSDFIKETAPAPGVGAYALAGAAAGFTAIPTAADGLTLPYGATDGSGYETGIGTYTHATRTLARTTIKKSSNSDNAVNWAGGTISIVVGLLADMVPATYGTTGQVLRGVTGAAPAWGAPLAIGDTITDATAGSILFAGAAGVVAQDNTNLKWGTTAGQGLTAKAGTAASAVSAFELSQTWNYATAAITGVKWTFTDTSSHANTLALHILGGVAGATDLLKLTKTGALQVADGSSTAPSYSFAGDPDTGFFSYTNGNFAVTNNGQVNFGYVGNSLIARSTGSYNFASGGTVLSRDTSITRLAEGVIQIGVGALAGSTGTIQCKHNSSDGSAGVSGTGTTITCKDGIITAIS
jgi:hypothetical protein